MKTILVIELVLLVCLTVAAADPERFVTGPNAVSFNPGLPASDYTVRAVPAVNGVGFAGTPFTRYLIWN